MKSMKEAKQHNGANGTRPPISQNTATFSLFSPEFHLNSNKVKHNALKAKVLENQFADRRHPKTNKPYIRFVIPICMDRTRTDNCYSVENFKDILYKLHSQFRRTTLIIDIVPTGELQGWNILRNQRFKQRKQSLETIPQDPTEYKALCDARLEGRRFANEWASELTETINQLNSFGHIVSIKHWPDAFPSNEQAKLINSNLQQLYDRGEAFSALIDDAIRVICSRLMSQGQSFINEAANPCILQYLLEELAFQVYIMKSTEEAYDFHLYEYDDLAPKLTQTTLAQFQGIENSNSKQPSLLEFKHAKTQSNQSKNSFSSNIGAQTQPSHQDFYAVSGEVLKKDAKGQHLSQEEVVIRNAFWDLYRERQAAAMCTSSDSTDSSPGTSPEK